jgi:hypothetical protein
MKKILNTFDELVRVWNTTPESVLLWVESNMAYSLKFLSNNFKSITVWGHLDLKQYVPNLPTTRWTESSVLLNIYQSSFLNILIFSITYLTLKLNAVSFTNMLECSLKQSAHNLYITSALKPGNHYSKIFHWLMWMWTK